MLFKQLFRILSQIIYSYLFTGCFSLGLTSIYLFLRDAKVDPSSLDPLPTILYWPIYSFASAQQVFGAEQAQIWHLFSISAILLFLFLVISSLAKEY